MNGRERDDRLWKIVGYVFAVGTVVLILEIIFGLGVGIACRIVDLISAS